MADKSTVVSIVPLPIHEEKPGLYPGVFKLRACKDGDIEILVVGRSVHYVYLDEHRGSLQVPTVSSEIARSICEDYINAKMGIIKDIAEPGIFYVDGEYTKQQIQAQFKKEIEAAKNRQKQWFIHLVEIADDEWAKYHTHKSISDLQRFAAKSLGLEREWNIEAAAESNTFCPACKNVVQVGAMVCGACRTIIDPEAYKKANFHAAVGA